VRWPVACAAIAIGLPACKDDPKSPVSTGGNVSITLDIPNGALDPKGYSDVNIIMHEPDRDLVRTVPVTSEGTFDLEAFDPADAVWVEATLRNQSGTAVGYGRTMTSQPLVKDAEIVVPVRRPILYFSGLVSNDTDGDPRTTNDIVWSEVPATFADLSQATSLDGSTTVGTKAVVMVSAGPELYMLEQATTSPTGTLTGPASIQPVSTGDHTLATALTGTMDGGVLDGAGTDDGAFLVVGTSTKLFVIDTASGAASPVGDGAFSKITMVNHGDGTSTAIAVKNRGSTTGTCTTTAELVAVDITPGTAPSAARSIATGGFFDVASDNHKAYYVDGCSGELGDITDGSKHVIRNGLGKTTALAAANGQAWIGVETGGTPAQIQVIATSLNASETSDPVRTIFSAGQQQVVEAQGFPGVQRALDAQTASINHLEVGAGGDYVAFSIAATYHANRVDAANFPQMDIETEELDILDAATAGAVQRYRSWCDGSILFQQTDITDWGCATAPGQTAPGPSEDHRIGSMTFLFGKK